MPKFPGLLPGYMHFYFPPSPVRLTSSLFLQLCLRVASSEESQLRQSRATRPVVHAECLSVSVIHRTLTRTTGSLTWAQMSMHAIAHEDVGTP